MSVKKYRHVFGPVPSRRLGRSLGVDLIPYKTCTLDCVYCQVGLTNHRTIERREYVPTDEVIAEIREKFASGAETDYVTLSGSGEPTLHVDCGKIIRAIKEITPVPVTVLTNGTLLWDDDVSEALMAADLVVPSLDAWDNETFQKINRPDAGLDFDRIIEGLKTFSHRFPGKLFLEVFLLDGPDVEQIAANIARIAKDIRHDRVHLNTVARPPAESDARPVPQEKMNQLMALFGGKAEVIADYRGRAGKKIISSAEEEIINVLERRPCTQKDIATALGLGDGETMKHLAFLEELGEIKAQETGGKRYYVRTPKDE